MPDQKAGSKDGQKTVVSNRKALRDYAVEDRYEAGLVLRGSEVKALREARAQFRDAFAVVEGNEVFLRGMHVSAYSAASTHESVEADRPRKLLLHKDEIEEISRATREKGMTVVPLRVYFVRGMAKVELGLARGRKTYDRRQVIAERDAARDVDRALGRARKGRD